MQHQLIRLVFVALMFLVCLGCSSDDGDDRSEPHRRCDVLIDEFCARASACSAPGASNCGEDARRTLDCSRAVATSNNYDACIAAVPQVDCAAFSTSTPLPQVCNGVILFPE